MKIFLYKSSVYSCHLFLISSGSVRSISFLSFIVVIFAWNVPLVSLIFLKRSLVFPILLFSFISLHWSLRKAYLSLLFFGTLHSDGYIFPFLHCLSLLFFSQLFVRPPQTTILPLLHFSLGMLLITTSYTVLQTFVHSSSGTLSDLIPWVYLSLPLYNHKGFDLGHVWMMQWPELPVRIQGFLICFQLFAFLDFAGDSVSKGSACNAGDLVSVSGSGRSPGGGSGYLL